MAREVPRNIARANNEGIARKNRGADGEGRNFTVSVSLFMGKHKDKITRADLPASGWRRKEEREGDTWRERITE